MAIGMSKIAILSLNFKSIYQALIPFFILASIAQGYSLFLLKMGIMREAVKVRGIAIVLYPYWPKPMLLTSISILWLCILGGSSLIIISFKFYSSFEWLRIINCVINFFWGLLISALLFNTIITLYISWYFLKIPPS